MRARTAFAAALWAALAVSGAIGQESPARAAMGNVLTLFSWAERCEVPVPIGYRQALAAEGERLQRLAGMSPDQVESLSTALAGQPLPDCRAVRATMGKVAADLLEEVRQVR